MMAIHFSSRLSRSFTYPSVTHSDELTLPQQVESGVERLWQNLGMREPLWFTGGVTSYSRWRDSGDDRRRRR